MAHRQATRIIIYHLSWQDTEKCDTFFLTIEGQALDPRPAAATTTNKGVFGDGSQRYSSGAAEGQGCAYPLLAGRI